MTLNFGKAERSQKLQVYSKGLFEVQSRISPNIYRVISLKKRKFHLIVHFTKMALHKSSVLTRRIEALKLMADNEPSEEEEKEQEEKTQPTTIVVEAKETNKKQREKKLIYKSIQPISRSTTRSAKLMAQLKMGRSIPI